MKRSIVASCGLLLSTAAVLPSAASADLAAHVDLFTGTGGVGHTHPAACRPFGMVQAGPDTGCGHWNYCSGYQYGDTHVIGYSQTHLSGTGCPDYGDIQILPFTGALGDMPARRAIDKSSERAEPGYYAVRQPADGITVEIAAARRAAIYRLTPARDGELRVLVNLTYGQGNPYRTNDFDGVWTSGARVRTHDGSILCGDHWRTGWIAKRRVGYALSFDRPWTSLARIPGRTDAPDEAPRFVAAFPVKAGEPLGLKVAFSTVDGDAARANLADGIPGWDFDGVRRAARADWNRILARTTCEGSAEEKTNWYTALYHLYSQPNDWADADGRYRGADNVVRRAADGTYYTTLSLWDTFRAAHPWYTLATPEIVAPVVNSLLAHYRAYGRLPVLSYGGMNMDCMIGNHAVPVIADAWAKGFRGFDPALAHEAVTNTLTVAHPGKPKEDWDLYDRHGCFPCDLVRGESVSRTLECAYDDWCAARFAQDAGFGTSAPFFRRRADFWKGVFDPSIGFARGRTSTGAWRTPFDPYAFGHGAESDNDFTEGNAFQYTWHVLHDAPGLMAAMGGKARFVARLDSLFAASEKITSAEEGTTVIDISGMIGQYVHGNEPSHHVIYFYPQAGHPEKAAERIRQVFDTQYHPGPDGLCGNDDCGQMSAWYVFSAMGFYPFNPCGGDYVVGAPQLPAATVALPGGKALRMTARNLSRANKYVRSVSFNGRPVTDWTLKHAELVRGGDLVFEMADRP